VDPAARLGADEIGLPLKVPGKSSRPDPAPTVGQHTEEVLRDVLGYDADRTAALREAGVLG